MFERRKIVAKVVLLPIENIVSSPFQAREEFKEEELRALAVSIEENGLLQPISVRRRAVGPGYELIAGERRLRACKMAGYSEIPAIVYEKEDAEAAALNLLENMQRAELNPFEQARGIAEVINHWGCSQSEAAHKLGLSQPALANKLRLLQLTEEQQQFVLQAGLTERHARAVLRLPEEQRNKALNHIVKQEMTVRMADAYVEQLLHTKPVTHRTVMVRDVRIFINTIDRAVKIMTQNGVPATTSSRETDGYLEYTVRIPTNAAMTRPKKEKSCAGAI